MQFTIQGPFKENLYNLMRKVGYHFQDKEKEQRELSFVRPPHDYPRFHLYLKTKGENLIFNLHLDQKRPIYKGSPAHAGEYDGEVVEKEVKRIKQILQNL